MVSRPNTLISLYTTNCCCCCRRNHSRGGNLIKSTKSLTFFISSFVQALCFWEEEEKGKQDRKVFQSSRLHRIPIDVRRLNKLFAVVLIHINKFVRSFSLLTFKSGATFFEPSIMQFLHGYSLESIDKHGLSRPRGYGVLEIWTH